MDSTDVGADIDRRDEVTRALGNLPPLHRQVLVLKYLDDRSVEEIAEELGRSRVQVQSMLQRARAGLRHELGEDDGRPA
jgi:RNA polymerase sigma factor (sigma-70 family)